MDIKNIKQKIKRHIAKRVLLKKNSSDLDKAMILEEFFTARVMAGEKYRSQQLIEIQNRVEEAKKMIKFLQEIK